MSRRRPSLAVDRADVMDFLRQSPRPGPEAAPSTPEPTASAVPARPKATAGPAGPAQARRAKTQKRQEKDKSEQKEIPRRVRATFQIETGVLDQARDAVVALSPSGLTLTRLFEEALLREIGRLRKELNGGRPFPPRSAPPKVGRPVSR